MAVAVAVAVAVVVVVPLCRCAAARLWPRTSGPQISCILEDRPGVVSDAVEVLEPKGDALKNEPVKQGHHDA